MDTNIEKEGVYQRSSTSDESSSCNQSTLKSTPPPPDGGYGWVCVFAQFLVNAFSWGSVASYSVYLAYYLSEDVFPDGTSIDFAFIGGLNFSVAVLMAPMATFLMRIWGPRPVMSIGLVFLPAGFVGASFASKIWQLYLSQGVCVGVGVGLIYMPASTIVPQWFLKKRSLANGICAAGAGIGGLITCLSAEAMLRNVGFRGSLRIMAGFSFAANLLAVILMRSRNEEIKPSLKMFDFRLLRDYHVVLLLGWSFIVMFGYITLMFSLSDYAEDIGQSGSNAATIPAILNLGAACGRPFIGLISDRFGRIKVAAVLTFACGILVFALWIPATSFAILVIFAFSSGAILGVFWSVIAPLAAEVKGLTHLPSLLSLVWISVSLPTAFAEVIALQLRRPGLGARTYLHPQIFVGLAYLVGSLLLFELWRSKAAQQRKEEEVARRASYTSDATIV